MGQEINILLIVVFVILSIILTVKYKQPTIFWLLIIGAIIGPQGLGWIANDDTIRIISEFGAILLLFAIGVKFSIHKLFRHGFLPLIVTSIKVGFIFLLSFFMISLFGFGLVPSLILSLIFSITSTTIVVKIIEQRGWINYKPVNLIVGILIIEDIIAVIILTFLSGFKDLKVETFVLQAIVVIVMFTLTYLFAVHILVRFTSWIMKNSNEDVIPFMAIVLVAGLSYITSRIGLSPSTGAFLAGSIVNFLPNSKEFEKSISSFILVFSSIFFISVGMLVNLKSMFDWKFALLAFTLITLIMIIKFIIVSGTTFFAGLKLDHAIFSGILLVPVGEFSLLIAREATLNLNIDLVSLTSMSILITSIITSMICIHYSGISSKIKEKIPERIKERVGMLQQLIKGAVINGKIKFKKTRDSRSK